MPKTGPVKGSSGQGIHVGMFVTVHFEGMDRYYDGEITQSVVDGHHWNIHIVYEDGDEENTKYPNRLIRVHHAGHGAARANLDLELVHNFLTNCPILKVWFINFIERKHKVPEWPDCKLHLSSGYGWPIDERIKYCRQKSSSLGRKVPRDNSGPKRTM